MVAAALKHPGVEIIAEAERLDDRCGEARWNLARAQAAGDELAMKAAGRYGGSALIAVFGMKPPLILVDRGSALRRYR